MGCGGCKNNLGSSKGSCKTGCVSCICGGYNSSYNWLSSMGVISNNNSVEISFKNGKKNFYKNVNNLELDTGDCVVVESSSGHDIGIVSLIGDIVEKQMTRKKFDTKKNEQKKIYRLATENDLSKFVQAKDKEQDLLLRARVLVKALNLKMKISDIDVQGDGRKAIFYFISDNRIDFRELVKKMLVEFKMKIELKQLGSRQETSILGGIGSCGRELCCTTWMTDFKSVQTSAARYQQLALNQEKLAGQCGKLKCCLNFELDQYVEQVKSFPNTRKQLLTKTGTGKHFKTDVLRKMMWYFIKDKDNKSELLAFTVDKVDELIKLNNKDIKPHSFTDFNISTEVKPEEKDYSSNVGQGDLNRFDKVFKKKKNKRRKINKNAKNK